MAFIACTVTWYEYATQELFDQTLYSSPRQVCTDKIERFQSFEELEAYCASEAFCHTLEEKIGYIDPACRMKLTYADPTGMYRHIIVEPIVDIEHVVLQYWIAYFDTSKENMKQFSDIPMVLQEIRKII